jgi:hypothetical protein
MKRKSNWRAKLDDRGLDFLEGYRKVSAIRNTINDPSAWHAKIEEIALEHPEIRVLARVDVLPEFLDLLLKSERAADFLSKFQPTAGAKTIPAPAARFVEVMQSVTLALEDPNVRVLAGVISASLAVLFLGIYEGISKANFGDAGPKETNEFLWTVGMTLEALAKAMKTGKPADLKGRVNVELIELIKALRQHQKAKLTYRELHEALEYAGMHVPDEESLRVFEWRARKKGWINPSEKAPKRKT